MRHLLEVDDLSPTELGRVLDLSERDDLPPVLSGGGAVLLFEKPSARTRTSVEMAVVQLGGHPVTLRNDEVGIDTRETAGDLGRLMSGQTPRAFVYKDYGALVNLSRFDTIGSLMGNLMGGSMALQGRIARFAYNSLYRMHLLAVHGWFMGAFMIAAGRVNKVLRPKLKLH